MQQMIDQEKFKERVRGTAEKAGTKVAAGIDRASELAQGVAREVRGALNLPEPAPVEEPPLPETASAVGRPRVFGVTATARLNQPKGDHFLIAEIERSIRIAQSSADGSRGRVSALPQGVLAIVADGVTIGAPGDLAARTAIETLATYAFSLMPWTRADSAADDGALVEGFGEAVRQAESEIESRKPAGAGDWRPAASMTAAYIAWPNLYTVQVGSTRAYLQRGGALLQLTQDDTEETPFAGSDDPSGRFVTNMVGGYRHAEAAVRHATLQPKDSLLLCTAEVASLLGEHDVAKHMTRMRDGGYAGEAECARGIIADAQLHGGSRGHLTAVVANF